MEHDKLEWKVVQEFLDLSSNVRVQVSRLDTARPKYSIRIVGQLQDRVSPYLRVEVTHTPGRATVSYGLVDEVSTFLSDALGWIEGDAQRCEDGYIERLEEREARRGRSPVPRQLPGLSQLAVARDGASPPREGKTARNRAKKQARK